MKVYNVELTFQQDLLGAVPKDKGVYETFIKSKSPNPEGSNDEILTIDEIEERGWTGFHMAEGAPIIYDYVIKGFFKDACSMLSRVSGKKKKGEDRIAKNHSSKLTAFKKVIDGLVFVKPRQIKIDMGDGEIGVMERPLRAMTMQGERVTLARSDSCPAGSKIKFSVCVLGEVTEEMLKEWFDYGILRGLGQWRNAGWGSFTYTMEAAA